MMLHQDERVQVELRARSVALWTRRPHACLSHAPLHGGVRRTRVVAIHETSNEALSVDVDPVALLRERMAELDPEGVGMWTSRRIGAAEVVATCVDGVEVVALVTAGLSNALRVGDTPGPLHDVGTINLVCAVGVPLTMAACLEAVAVAVEARTTAVCEARVSSRRSGRIATGTGTDCVAVLHPEGGQGDDAPRVYAGKHTAVGSAVGDAVYRATSAAITAWKADTAR